MCYGHRVMYIQILLAWWIFYRTPRLWFQVLFISSEWILFMLFDHVLTQKMYTYVNKWIQLFICLSKEACCLMINMFHMACTWIKCLDIPIAEILANIYLYLLYELNCNQAFNIGFIRNMILSTIHSTLQKFYHIDFSLTTKSTCMVFSYYLSWTVEICIMNYIHYPLLCLPLVTVTHRLQF